MLTSTTKHIHEESLFYLEKEGKRYSRKIAKAARQIHWLLRIFQLIWIAGPVTYIALQCGYYLGYGKAAPLSLFIYFASYTLIAGFIGLLVTVTYHTFSSSKQDVASKSLSSVIDSLTDLLVMIRDLKTMNLSSAQKKLESARVILENTNADSLAIKFAIKTITNNNFIADKAAEIEIYRRAGLFSRVYECQESISEELNCCLLKLEIKNPELEQLVRKRFFGQSPTIKDGLVRNDNFIRRLLLASKEENENLITINDIEEIIVLALELLAGREFNALTFKYKGNRRLSKKYDALDKSKNDYELALTSYRSRVKALHAYLTSLEYTDVDYNSLNFSFIEQLRLCESGLEHCYQHLKEVYIDQKNNDALLDKKIVKIFNEFKLAYKLYKDAFRQTKKIKDKKFSFNKSIKDWELLASKLPDAHSELKLDRGKGGLKVVEHDINLKDDEKINVSFDIEKRLVTYKKLLKRGFRPVNNDSAQIEVDRFKQLAIDISLILAEYVPLNNPLMQYAIETSYAANFSAIEVGATAKTKVGFLSSMVAEVNDNRAVIGKGFAKGLVRQYGMHLNSAVINFLANSYDVDYDFFSKLESESKNSKVLPENIQCNTVMHLSEPRKHWYKLLETVQTFVNKQYTAA